MCNTVGDPHEVVSIVSLCLWVCSYEIKANTSSTPFRFSNHPERLVYPWFSAFKSYTVSLIGYVIALDYQLCPLGETLGSSRAFKTHTVLLVSMVWSLSPIPNSVILSGWFGCPGEYSTSKIQLVYCMEIILIHMEVLILWCSFLRGHHACLNSGY